MARNSKRSKLGTDLEDSKPAVADSVAEALETGGLSFATPTEFVDLPSGGRYYPETHPLHGEGSIEIKYMTAKEEDILSSKTLIKQGVAITRLLKSVIVDKRINPDTLISGDRNAILGATRITGYGADYETIITTTPLSKLEVEMKLMTGKDESYLSRLVESKRKKKLPETTLTDTLKVLITSVNGHESKEYINQFVKMVPARDSRHLRTVYEKASPNVDMSQHYECDTCGFVTDLEVPFTPDFFWPKQ